MRLLLSKFIHLPTFAVLHFLASAFPYIERCDQSLATAVLTQHRFIPQILQRRFISTTFAIQTDRSHPTSLHSVKPTTACGVSRPSLLFLPDGRSPSNPYAITNNFNNQPAA